MQKRGLRVRTAFFLATVFTTTFFGGWRYSMSLLAILLAHEFGHYLVALRYGLKPTLPLFLPAPPPFGTFGAFIQLTARIPNRKVLFDLAAAGPLAGLVVAIPLTALSIAYADPTPISTDQVILGTPLLFKFLEWLIHGTLTGQQIILNPVAFAGWVGLFITGLNLLPVGQLDGGHIAHAVFGRLSRAVSLAAVFALALFAGMQYFFFIMLLLLFGMHPVPIENADISLGSGRKKIAGILFILFVLCFIPKIVVR